MPLHFVLFARIGSIDHEDQGRRGCALWQANVSRDFLALERDVNNFQGWIEKAPIIAKRGQRILIRFLFAGRIRDGPAGHCEVAEGPEIIVTSRVVILGGFFTLRASFVLLADGAPSRGPLVSVEAVNVGKRIASIFG